MRNLTLSIIALGACFLVFTNVQAQADMISYDFQCPQGTDINTYMTNMMGSEVHVKNAELVCNGKWSLLKWYGKDRDDYYMQTDDKNYMEIKFSTPITRVKGDGYVFMPGLDRQDFCIVGYYGDTEVGKYTKNTGICDEVPFDLTFDSPACKLVISNNWKHLVAIDNLCVEPAAVPVPGAGLLGMLGMGITGWLKRRKSL